MEPSNPGRKSPDFKELNDRFINSPSESPKLFIKTNLDVKDTKKNNPYDNSERINSEGFDDFFK